MRVAMVDQPGQVPRASELPEPHLEDGEQIVELVAAGLHPVVKALAGGAHYGSTNGPLVPGVDAVGKTRDGRFVYTGFIRKPYGTFAERMAAPRVLPLPDDATRELAIQVAAALNPGMSSWLPLRSLEELGTVWILGATGAAGRLAIQNARELGADRVVAVVRRSVDVGADATIVVGNGKDQDVAAVAAEAANARPTTILDFVWGPVAEAVFGGLTRTTMDDDATVTTYIEIGQSAGSEAALPAALLRSSAITIRGSGAGGTPIAQIMAELPAYVERICAGKVSLPVTLFPLDQIAAAWVHDGPRAVIVT